MSSLFFHLHRFDLHTGCFKSTLPVGHEEVVVSQSRDDWIMAKFIFFCVSIMAIILPPNSYISEAFTSKIFHCLRTATMRAILKGQYRPTNVLMNSAVISRWVNVKKVTDRCVFSMKRTEFIYFFQPTVFNVTLSCQVNQLY